LDRWTYEPWILLSGVRQFVFGKTVVGKLTFDGFPGAAGTVTVWITALYHEPFYYSVESETVIESFFCKGYKMSTVSGAYSGYSSRIILPPSSISICTFDA